MEQKIERQVICPHCGASVTVEVTPVINVSRQPELRDRIMDESLFHWNCTACDFRAQLVFPCLYHDPDRKFIVYLVPEFSGEMLDDSEIEAQYPEMASTTKRVVSGLTGHKEKIHIFESEADDMAIELTKLAVSSVVRKKYDRAIACAYFLHLDKEANTIGFSFFLEGEPAPVFYDTRLDVYEKCLTIVKECATEQQRDLRYLNIDNAWAEKTLADYRK